jgi:hypothetical protein
MTIDGLAGRLGAAASEVEGIRGELERAQPVAVDGPRSVEVLEQIRLAWVGQRDTAARVAEQIRRLSVDVTQAAQTYRAADDLGRGHGHGD